jgi:serine/threonine protein kinase
VLTGVSPFSQRLDSSTHPSDDDDNEEEEIDKEEDNDNEVLKRALKASSLDLSSILKIHGGRGGGEGGDVLEQDADDAVDLVRKLLQPDPTHRPCVHRVMQHPFFVRCRHFDWNDVLTRSYVPPEIPSSIIDDKRRRRLRRDKKNEDKPTKVEREEKQGGHSSSLTTSSPPPPPLRFGKDTFLGMSESLFEARRAGGILSSSSSSSLSSHRDDPLELLHEFNI